jgi:hypothetical protein
MNETNKSRTPFEPLGKQLKRMRISRQESLAEVSGAVEIDIDDLQTIEQGVVCPNEDILMLLISHFGIKEDEAEKLWGLAGYDKSGLPIVTASNDDQALKPAVIVTPEDLKIVYTDMVHVSVNNFGVIMNFMQGAGPNSPPLAIARVGMSREHAESVVEILQKTLNASKPKELPEPKTSKKKNND